MLGKLACFFILQHAYDPVYLEMNTFPDFIYLEDQLDTQEKKNCLVFKPRNNLL